MRNLKFNYAYISSRHKLIFGDVGAKQVMIIMDVSNFLSLCRGLEFPYER
jgi:hypothetical protein